MATTPNYSFSVYSSTDTGVRFLDFRVATAGSQSTSNFYVIDTVLKQHSDAIDSINATPSAFVVKGTYSSGSLYTASVANYPGYKNEQLIVLSLNQKNTGAVQININGTTNKDVMKYGSDGVLKAVEAGDFVANSPVLCLYDGTRFVVIGITSASSITATGEAGDILQIADDGTIESSGKKAAQPNGIATLDENGNVVQVANMANSAAAVYSGTPVSIAYAGAQRIASITAYGENAQGGTTEAPVALTGVDSVFVGGNNLLPKAVRTETTGGITFTPNPDGSILVSGTATTNVGYSYARFERALLGRTVCLSGGSTQAQVLINERLSSGAFVRNVLVDRGQWISGTLTKQKEDNILYATIQVLAGTTVNTTIYPMLNLGESPLPYEPYWSRIIPLPIPRPLRRVGDVKDKCVTRVKSVYDKRIVLSSADGFSFSSNAGNGYARFYKGYNSAKLSPIASDWLPGYAKTAYDATNEGVYSADSDAGTISIVLSIQRLIAAGATSGDTSTYLSAASAIFSAHPLTVYYQSTAYDGTNGLDVCLTEYQNDFVELDGTEDVVFDTYGNTQKRIRFDLDRNAIARYALKFSHGNPGDTPTVTGGISASFNRDVLNRLQIIGIADTWTALGVTDTATAKTWLAAQKEAGTPVQIAYQLATPEVYVTDPVDFDNTAGPLTVVTGGQVEVKMTDFVTDRTPAFLNKLDKTGDGSDVTVTFTEAATDTDIASGDKLSILFGKILKRFTNILNGTTKVGYATKADTDNLGNQITETYANSLDVADNTIVLKNKIGENLSTITVPYANSAGNVATSIKGMGIAVQTASPYAWFLNYTGSGNKDGARKYYASVYADNATYSTSAGSSNNIVIYNNNWSGTDGSISAIYANAEKTYVNLTSSNAAGTAWPNISVQRINGHALNMALNGTSLSITW